MGTTQAMAAWIADLRGGDIPEAALAVARRAFLDTVGVILAGVGEPVTRMVAELAAEAGAPGPAAQLGAGLRTAPAWAALVNATSGHALDYDDVSESVTGHPSVVIVPVVLAVGQAVHATGRQLLEAYAVGVEVMAKLGVALGPEHYRRGWHATATVGTLGAAAAAGRLLGLDERRLTHALAIAVSQASGSRQNFGTMTKPLHPGHAAFCGVVAAQLAAKGMTADVGALEAPLGFFALFGYGQGRPEEVAAALGRPFDLVRPGLSVKKYPCCFATHRAADAVLALGVPAAEVAAVEVTVPPGGLQPLIHDRPRTGLEGKFSMPYVVAAALLDGRLVLDSFTDAAVRRPAVAALLPAIHVREDPAVAVARNAMEEGEVAVAVTLRDGRRLERRVRWPRGSPADPLSEAELAAKFRDCAHRALPAAGVEAALRALADLDGVADANDLVARLVPAPAGAAA
jgi:2-methylcitrate dehydratase PrpD